MTYKCTWWNDLELSRVDHNGGKDGFRFYQSWTRCSNWDVLNSLTNFSTLKYFFEMSREWKHLQSITSFFWRRNCLSPFRARTSISFDGWSPFVRKKTKQSNSTSVFFSSNGRRWYLLPLLQIKTFSDLQRFKKKLELNQKGGMKQIKDELEGNKVLAAAGVAAAAAAETSFLADRRRRLSAAAARSCCRCCCRCD